MLLFVHYLLIFGCNPSNKLTVFNTSPIGYRVAMASNANISPGPEDSSFSVLIVARLIVHTTKQENKKKTTKKDTKTKEFSHIFCDQIQLSRVSFYYSYKASHW